MTALARLLQACLLSGAGLFMVALATSPDYWMFLNPKYTPLTMAAGSLIILLGLTVLLDAGRKVRLSECLAPAVFLAIALGATTLTNPFEEFAATVPEATFTDFLEMDAPPKEPDAPRLVIDDREYVKMNAAEIINGVEDGVVRRGDRVAVQGLATRTPELDKAGYIALSRLFIACCFADALGVSVLVKVDRPDAYLPGQWLRAAGTLAPAANTYTDIPLPVRGAISSLTVGGLAVDSVETTETQPPQIPFLFELRQEEPFAY